MWNPTGTQGQGLKRISMCLINHNYLWNLREDSSGHQFEWESQPKIGSIYGGNLLLLSAILSKVLHITVSPCNELPVLCTY